MAWDSTPWMVGGGAEHSVEVARLLAYVATSAGDGIITPTDLRVTQLPAAGNAVRIMPGAAALRQRYGGTPRQTYLTRNTAAVDVPINATGSGGSGRTDLVIARILDPQYEGSAPADPNDFQYAYPDVIESVSEGITSFTELGLNYPAIALAKITRPANTDFVTDAHIVDLRQMAVPLSRPAKRTYALVDPDTERLTSTGTYGEVWPNAATNGWGPVPIPEWATRASISMRWEGVQFAGPSSSYGRQWVQIGGGAVGGPGSVVTQTVRFDGPNGVSGNTRMTLAASDDIAIPAEMRGTSQRFYPKARVDGTSGAGDGRPLLDWGSSMSLDILFYNDAA